MEVSGATDGAMFSGRMRRLVSLFFVFLLLGFVMFFEISFVKASPMYEDFTKYEEQDSNNHIDFTANHIDFVHQYDEEAWLYDDKDTDHFGDFDHKIDVKSVSAVNYGMLPFWMLSNDVDSYLDLKGASKTVVMLDLYRTGAGAYGAELREAYGGNEYYDIDYVTLTQGIQYYVRIKKSGISLTVDFYTSSANCDGEVGSVLQLSLTLQTDHKFQYIFSAPSCRGDSSAYPHEGDVDNLDLQEPIYVYMDLYFMEGGQFRLDNATFVNGTQYEYENETVVGWEFLAVPFNVSWLFLNFTWDGSYNSTNPYDFNATLYGNLSVWCVFGVVSGGDGVKFVKRPYPYILLAVVFTALLLGVVISYLVVSFR